jgi:hypothetical protein
MKFATTCLLLRAFPDARMEINEQLGERDLVATRKTLSPGIPSE